MAESKNEKRPRRPPARSPEEWEDRIIGMTMELAEKQIREGTATSQVMTHFLKAASSREQLEREKLKHENELLKAKTDAMASAARIEVLYEDALKAMRSYQGSPVEESYED